MRTRKTTGEMIVEAGLLSQEQVDGALSSCKDPGKRLGEYLIEQGMLKEEDVVQILSIQFRVARYSPDAYPAEESLSSVLSSETAQKYKVAPLKKDQGVLHVAMPDPTDLSALDALEQITGLEVEPVICTRRELQLITDNVYGVSAGLGGILETINGMEYTAGDMDDRKDLELRSLVDMAEGAPVVRTVNWILAQAVRENASDIHISPERKYIQLRFRVDGRLREVPAPPRSMLLAIVSRIKILANMDIATTRMPQDGRFTTRIDNREINIRVSTIPTVNGENVVMRLLDMSAARYTLDTLGMAQRDRDRIEALIVKPYGMIVSTGPTGSGKSTSLYAILRKLNDPGVNIITVEDPVEYRVEKVRQVQLNAKAGMTFASGLRSILRQDPDIIMVGEIRDAETAGIAVQAALTGHIVLSTIHTNDAAGAVTRLLDMGIEPFLVASVLMVSFAQRLLRRLCAECAAPYKPTDEALSFWGIAGRGDVEFKKAMGCYKCMNMGYQGRIGVFEVLVIDELLQRMIVSKASAQEMVRAAREAGELRTLREDAAEKVAAGITSMEEAISKVMA